MMLTTFSYLFVICAIQEFLTHASLAISAPSARRPHIVFILADDLGWDDISLHGSDEIPTPNIDALASDGLVLNNYYVQPLCTPSRAALMTGRHPIQLGLQHSVIQMAEPYGLGLEETLMPEYLKEIGYKTHMLGKWHLGFFNEAYTPTQRGFDSHFGYYMGYEDYYDHTHGYNATNWGLDFWRDAEVEKNYYGQYSTEIFTTEAENIIRKHDPESPLFIYMAHQAVHSGNPGNPQRLQAPWKYVSKFPNIQSQERRMLAAMVSALDDSVGNVTRALQEKGILNETIIVFSTDNGGPADRQNFNDACNWPLRGAKRTIWEGGVRGIGLMWTPLLKRGIYSSLMHITDWLPTLLDASGYNGNLPEIYGVSHWGALQEKTKAPRSEILLNIDPINGDGALRIDDMKFVYGGGDTKRFPGWYKPDKLSERSDMVNRDRCKRPLITDQNAKLCSSTRALASLGRRMSDENRIVVKCGKKPKDPKFDCKPWVKPCLFNITQDPCEYWNIIGDHPDIATKLHERVMELSRSAVPPKILPDDPEGFPVHHGGIWRPWR